MSNDKIHTTARVHPTAIIERDVVVGPESSIWDAVHVRHGAHIGAQCVVGEKSYIAYDVKIGNRVKINAMVYICYGVAIEDGVMISAGTIFTNDVFPRATTPDLQSPITSEPTAETQATLVRQGATIGAGCTVGSGLAIGQFAMVGMGSVVTRSVGDFELVVGNPARSVGCVCRCGQPVLRWSVGQMPEHAHADCAACGDRYSIVAGRVQLANAAAGGTQQ